jgi:hypothetical protein
VQQQPLRVVLTCAGAVLAQFCVTPCHALMATRASYAYASQPYMYHMHSAMQSSLAVCDQQLLLLLAVVQVCNLAWSKNVNELVSAHGYSQNQIIVWKYPSMAKLATLTGHSYRWAATADRSWRAVLVACRVCARHLGTSCWITQSVWHGCRHKKAATGWAPVHCNSRAGCHWMVACLSCVCSST